MASTTSLMAKRSADTTTPDHMSLVYYPTIDLTARWITNGVFADYFTVAVRTGGAGMSGLSLLLIEKSMPGVTARQMQCQGMWPSGTSYVTFEVRTRGFTHASREPARVRVIFIYL